MPSMLDAERRSADVTNDFVVMSRVELQALKDRISELELEHEEFIDELVRRLEVWQNRAIIAEAEILKVKQAAATGAWCRRNHHDYNGSAAEFLPPLPTTIC